MLLVKNGAIKLHRKVGKSVKRQQDALCKRKTVTCAYNMSRNVIFLSRILSPQSRWRCRRGSKQALVAIHQISAHCSLWAPESADLVAVLEGSSEALVAGLAGELAAAQAGRASNSVAARFRDQLRDLITRLDRCAPRA